MILNLFPTELLIRHWYRLNNTMVDFKNNELNIGDTVILIECRGVRSLKEGTITRLTPQKAEVQYSLDNWKGVAYNTRTMKESHQLFKIESNG